MTTLQQWDTACLRVLILRLSPLRDVDRSTPHHFLNWEITREFPDAFVDFAFFPAYAERKKNEAEGKSLIHGVFSNQLPEAFDFILVSNSCGVELVNFPYLLQRSRIPLLASQRGENFPPIIFGGSNALASQGVINNDGDSFADAVFFGEGERAVGTMTRILHESKHLPKRERLLQVAKAVNGLWVSGDLTQTVTKTICHAPDLSILPVKYPVFDGEQADTARLQIAHGCPCFCSFCFEAYDRKPYREMALADLKIAARQLKINQGAQAIELYSFNFNSHADIVALLQDLSKCYDRVSVKSQRIDFLVEVPGLYDTELLIDKRSFTLGVEGISEKQRAFLHKSVSLEQIHNCIQDLLVRKVREMKFFFILSGHEDADDFAELRTLLSRIRTMRNSIHEHTRIIFSCGLLVRMPLTPLQYDRLQLDQSAWEPIQSAMRNAVVSHGFEFRLAADWDDYFFSQVVALGGYWLHDAITAMAKQGFFYDSALSPGIAVAMEKWIHDNGHWTKAFLEEKSADYPFPLAFVKGGVMPQFLYREFKNSKAAIDKGYCLGSKCQACGACETHDQTKFLTGHSITPGTAEDVRTMANVIQQKRRLKNTFIKVKLPRSAAWKSPEWMSAYLMRQLLAWLPDEVENILSLRESLFYYGELEARLGGVTGWTVFALKAWDNAQFLKALSPFSEQTENGLQILGDDFTEGTFSRASLHVELPTQLFPKSANVLAKFLQEQYCPCNLRKTETGTLLEISDKGLKKKQIFSATIETNGSMTVLNLEIGKHFDLLSFLKQFPHGDWRLGGFAEIIQLKHP